MKTCTKCKAEKPAEEFNKRSISSDGLQPLCRSCEADYRSANRELVRKRSTDWKSKNKEHLAIYAACYYSANKDRLSAYKAENRERFARRDSQYYEANKERIAARNAAWRLANPEKHAERERNRRALKLSSGGTHTVADIARIFERQRGFCANCHAKLFKSGKQKFHVDHIVPLARGGSNWPDNLQCLCPQCNLSKGAKDPLEWAQQNGRLI